MCSTDLTSAIRHLGKSFSNAKMNLKLFLLALLILVERCVSQDYVIIDDIPIESYDHGDHQENAMDIELLPTRHGRSSDDELKDFYFRSMRSFGDQDDIRSLGPYQDIPRAIIPLGNVQVKNRKKRSNSDLTPVSGIVKNLGEPLEVVPLEAKNLTEDGEKAESKSLPENINDVQINDFIRFRRSPLHEQSKQESSVMSEKMVMEPSDESVNRESRGTKVSEQWVKSVYPVRKSDDEMDFNDNLPASSDNSRAPRVSFVTQKYEDNRYRNNPSEFRTYERDFKPRYFEREAERPRGDLDREMSRDFMYRRKFRSFPLPAPDRAYYRDELYDPREYHRPRYDNYYRNRNDYSAPVQRASAQKRIIYYATLPEVPRSPPRDRYDPYRYDDRYLNDQYNYRANYPKSRYEEEGKRPYPVKVLTDVNVRDVKKNPERRIFSEVDRTRYAYNTPPYRAADG